MHKIFLLIFLHLTIFNFLQADYLLKINARHPSKIDQMPKGIVDDMKNIPQNPAYYAKQIKPFSLSEQKELDDLFNKKYFEPWNIEALDISKEDFGWEIRFVRKKPIYKAQGVRIPSSVYEKWIDNANYENIDTKKYKAITVRRTEVKALPTATAFFRDPKKTGEGFPFDYNQNSALHINIPLYVSHISKDKRWTFVRASYAFGWVKTKDIALVDKKFIKSFKNDKYAVVLKDNMRLYDEQNKSVSFVKLGAVFPMTKDSKKGTKRYLVANRNAKGQGILHQVKLNNAYTLAKKPLPFNAKNVAIIAKQFYGEPYGWGGSYECRDCSATTRDFLGVFGIFLRRNSSKQAKDGTSIPMKNWPKAYKKKFINDNAEPFRSLLYVPGHIVLYLGQYNGEPVIMHTYWGIRKNDGSKIITGRTIITTTEPGKERKDVKERAKLIHTLRSIVNF